MSGMLHERGAQEVKRWRAELGYTVRLVKVCDVEQGWSSQVTGCRIGVRRRKSDLKAVMDGKRIDAVICGGQELPNAQRWAWKEGRSRWDRRMRSLQLHEGKRDRSMRDRKGEARGRTATDVRWQWQWWWCPFRL